ncbi:methyltransferase domain-containing protein [Nostoc sp. UHCC 0252]|nr:methyltransferase domain-containing protein [Nostoc sp. UHCC 0252]MEA5605304.1 methyltransferase domain-containing protein [Nostoc sp. UHCC 0252]
MLPHLVHVHQMDALAMSFPAKYFDHVLGIEAIYHLKDKKTLFAKIKEVLKPGGYLVFSDYTLETPYSWLLYEVATEMVESKHLIGIDDYHEMLSNAGFIGINSIDVTKNTMMKTFEYEKDENYRNVKEYVRVNYGIFSYLLVSLLVPVITYLLLEGVKNNKLTLQFISCENDC